MDLIEILSKRYTTKSYDPQKKIPDHVFNQLLESLRLSPSSCNIQPWQFFITTTQDGKQRVAKSTADFANGNVNRILNASHVIILTAQKKLNKDYLEALNIQEEQDHRNSAHASKVRDFFYELHKTKLKDVPSWLAKQLYLACGFLIVSAALLDIDATIIEGFRPTVLSKEFHFKEKELQPVLIVSLGYHAKDDKNAMMPKSRWPEEEIFTFF